MLGNATKRVLEYFPALEKHIHGCRNNDGDIPQLDAIENVFLQLVRFFQHPDKENFHLGTLYKQLDNDWLEFALEVIYIYFQQDTYLIRESNHSIITDGDYYMNQSRFAEFLNENGLKYDRSKLNVYIEREKAPAADIVISGTKYWERSTCERFLYEELNKLS